MNQTLTIHHDLGDVVLTPNGHINPSRLKNMIRSTLDQYLEEDRVPAKTIHSDRKQQHGEYYRTARYHLRVYRQRLDLTQAELAKNGYSSAPFIRDGK